VCGEIGAGGEIGVGAGSVHEGKVQGLVSEIGPVHAKPPLLGCIADLSCSWVASAQEPLHEVQIDQGFHVQFCGSCKSVNSW